MPIHRRKSISAPLTYWVLDCDWTLDCDWVLDCDRGRRSGAPLLSGD